MIQQSNPVALDASVEEGRAQWTAWAAGQPGIPKRQRTRAVDAAFAALRAGATAEQAAAAGVAAAKEGYAAYYARASVIVGAISLVISLATTGVPLLLGVYAAFSAYQGLKSATRHTEAIVGSILCGLSLLAFAGHLFGLRL